MQVFPSHPRVNTAGPRLVLVLSAFQNRAQPRPSAPIKPCSHYDLSFRKIAWTNCLMHKWQCNSSVGRGGPWSMWLPPMPCRSLSQAHEAQRNSTKQVQSPQQEGLKIVFITLCFLILNSMIKWFSKRIARTSAVEGRVRNPWAVLSFVMAPVVEGRG